MVFVLTNIIFGLPTGPRIVVNDSKPDGTKTAYAISVVRDSGCFFINIIYLYFYNLYILNKNK